MSGGAVTNINDQSGVLMEEKKGCATALEHMSAERQKVLDLSRGFFDITE